MTESSKLEPLFCYRQARSSTSRTQRRLARRCGESSSPLTHRVPAKLKLVQTPDVDENVLGTLSSLPGCNPITSGPDNATPCTAPTTPATFASPATYTGAAPPPGAKVPSNSPRVLQSVGSWSYVDCYSDNVGGVRALATGLANPNHTVPGCLAACAAAAFSICGVEYQCVSLLAPKDGFLTCLVLAENAGAGTPSQIAPAQLGTAHAASFAPATRLRIAEEATPWTSTLDRYVFQVRR